MFPLCNLLTRAKEPGRLPVASRIRPGFLMSNSLYFTDKSKFRGSSLHLNTTGSIVINFYSLNVGTITFKESICRIQIFLK